MSFPAEDEKNLQTAVGCTMIGCGLLLIVGLIPIVIWLWRWGLR